MNDNFDAVCQYFWDKLNLLNDVVSNAGGEKRLASVLDCPYVDDDGFFCVKVRFKKETSLYFIFDIIFSEFSYKESCICDDYILFRKEI